MREDIFISYKRQYSTVEAHTIYYGLKNAGFIPYMDVHNKETGDFPSHLKEKISNCKYFLLVCTEGSMDNLMSEKDWVRKEIEIAYHTPGVSILPIYFENFDNSILGTFHPEIKLDNQQAQHFTYDTPDENMASLLEYLKNCINQNQLTDILLECLQSGVSVRKISEYILESKEMQSTKDTEILLLTNNVIDYDFTVISKMAISSNIQKNVKYIYYIPRNCIQDVKALKNQITHYAQKTEQALSEIDGWLRTMYISKLGKTQRVIAWLTDFEKKKMHDVVKSLTNNGKNHNDIEVLLDEISIYDSNDIETLVLDFSSVIELLKGKTNLAMDIEETIDIMKKVSKLCLDDEGQTEYQQSWIKNTKFISQVFDLSVWINQSKKDKALSKAIKSFLKSCKIDMQIYDWLCQDPLNEGVRFEEAMDNIIVHEIDEKSLSLNVCYNFSLFMRNDDSVVASDWYLATHRNPDDLSSDNDVMVCDLSGEQINKLQEVFEYIDRVEQSQNKSSRGKQ